MAAGSRDGGDTDDDPAGFDVGTPDEPRSVRAERPGNGGDREYELAYTRRDAAANTCRCAAHIAVPHDHVGQKTG
jgi:hypothetical protein